MEDKKVWLNAWYDPLASAAVLSNCMTIADLYGDGDYKLVAAICANNPLAKNNVNNQQQQHKLRVYKGKIIIIILTYHFFNRNKHGQ